MPKRLPFLLCALVSARLMAEKPPWGPVPTRDLFPLNLLPMVYQPAPPDLLAPGQWEVNLEHVRANTLEFSDFIKDGLPDRPAERIHLTRSGAEAVLAQHPEWPLVFFFDEETQRGELRLRWGLPGGFECFLQVPVLTYSGGFLDGGIEAFHRLGFEQSGRDDFDRNRVVMCVGQHGRLVFYTEGSVPNRVKDPVLGLARGLRAAPDLALSLVVQVKPSLSRNYEYYHSGWDSAVQLTGRWSPNRTGDCYFGAGYVHRESGSPYFNEVGFRDQVGAHLGWESRRFGALHPFFQLYYLTGTMGKAPGQKLDRPSLQHDLGLRWEFRSDSQFYFRYMNNITHNENTADMALALGLSLRFGRGCE